MGYHIKNKKLYIFWYEKGTDMGSQTSSKTSQRGGCNPLNPPPGSTYAEQDNISLLCAIKGKMRWKKFVLFSTHNNSKQSHFNNSEYITQVFQHNIIQISKTIN